MIISVENEHSLDHVSNYFEDVTDQLKVKSLDFLEEDRKMAYSRSIAYKEKMKKCFVKQVCLRDFHEGDLILGRVNGPRKEANEEKMAANQEGPYKIAKSLQNEAYQLKLINGEKQPRIQNCSHLCKYYVQII